MCTHAHTLEERERERERERPAIWTIQMGIQLLRGRLSQDLCRRRRREEERDPIPERHREI